MMVSDSKVTIENKNEDHVYHAAKIFRAVNGDLLGAAGTNSSCEAFFKWYGTKRKKPKLTDDFEAIVLTKTGKLVFYDETLSRDVLNHDHYACGSGGNAARAAMYMGANPVRAVEIACLVDPHSGPPIQILVREEDDKLQSQEVQTQANQAAQGFVAGFKQESPISQIQGSGTKAAAGQGSSEGN